MDEDDDNPIYEFLGDVLVDVAIWGYQPRKPTFWILLALAGLIYYLGKH